MILIYPKARLMITSATTKAARPLVAPKLIGLSRNPGRTNEPSAFAHSPRKKTALASENDATSARMRKFSLDTSGNTPE
jgi:hypothetical protein